MPVLLQRRRANRSGRRERQTGVSMVVRTSVNENVPIVTPHEAVDTFQK